MIGSPLRVPVWVSTAKTAVTDRRVIRSQPFSSSPVRAYLTAVAKSISAPYWLPSRIWIGYMVRSLRRVAYKDNVTADARTVSTRYHEVSGVLLNLADHARQAYAAGWAASGGPVTPP